MFFLFYAATVFLFPAAAARAWHRSGERGLALVTLIAVSTIFVLALVMASERGGNRLVQTHGYAHTASRTLLFAGLALIFPVVASAISVLVAAPRNRPGFVYPIAFATALIGAAIGTIVAIYML